MRCEYKVSLRWNFTANNGVGNSSFFVRESHKSQTMFFAAGILKENE